MQGRGAAALIGEMQGRGASALMGEMQFLGTQRLAQDPKRRGETPASAPVPKPGHQPLSPCLLPLKRERARGRGAPSPVWRPLRREVVPRSTPKGLPGE